MTASELIAAEERCVTAWNAGLINSKTHFSLSTDGLHEEWLCGYYASNVRPQDYVLATHRGHYHFLLSGGTPDELLQACLDGMSMHLYGPRFITSAIVAGVCGIAVGLAMAGHRCHVFVGDGAEEAGEFAEAVHCVWNRNLPVTFVVEDNDSSAGVSQGERQTTKRFPWPDCVIRARYKLRTPHSGSGEKIVLKSLKPHAPL